MKEVIRRENSTFSRNDLEAFLTEADHLDIADVFRSTVQNHRYFSFLRSHYRRQVRPSQLHRAIAALPITTVFTTNYDKLLETAFRQSNGIDPAVIIYPEQLGYIDNTEVRIIKLHGDIDHPSSIVLTRTDYALYASRHKDFERMFHNSDNNYTLVFIGFGLRDPKFKRVYLDARSLYDSGKCLAYAIMTGTNRVEGNLWEKDGLRIIPARSHHHVVSIVKVLGAVTSGGAP
jgi:hypothetical protein